MVYQDRLDDVKAIWYSVQF